MENRRKLHDYGLVMLILGFLNLFMFGTTIVAGFVDGTIPKAFETVEADILLAVKIGVGIVGGLMGLLVFADAFLGIKALKVSKNPNAAKGYITVAKIFLVLSVISAASAIVSLFSGSINIVDGILNAVSSSLSAVIYIMFVGAAQAVRNDVLNGVN